MESTFWQANFWGIIGTVAGALGLIISWLNRRYSMPEIVVVKLELETPYNSHIKNLAEKLPQKEYYAEFVLHIRLRNKKGGSGSIEKPNLILRYKTHPRFLIIPRYKEYSLTPKTKHTEWEKETETISRGITIRHGEAWNFSGGETVDDELEYVFRDAEFYDFIKIWDKIEYFAEYHNNFGEQFRRRILKIGEKR